MSSFVYKDLEIKIEYKKRLKHTYIHIKAEKIIIKTPNNSHKYIVELLNHKENWIRKKIHQHRFSKIYDFSLEDEILLYGEKYSIDVREAHYLRKRLSRIRIASKQNIIKCYDDFYKTLCHDYLTQRVEYFAQIMNLEYEGLKFRKMRARWGSCSSLKVLTFNSELIKLEKELIDYVVVHELAHLVHMNHSHNFHSLVQRYLQNSQNSRVRLKKVVLSGLFYS